MINLLYLQSLHTLLPMTTTMELESLFESESLFKSQPYTVVSASVTTCETHNGFWADDCDEEEGEEEGEEGEEEGEEGEEEADGDEEYVDATDGTESGTASGTTDAVLNPDAEIILEDKNPDYALSAPTSEVTEDVPTSEGTKDWDSADEEDEAPEPVPEIQSFVFPQNNSTFIPCIMIRAMPCRPPPVIQPCWRIKSMHTSSS